MKSLLATLTLAATTFSALAASTPAPAAGIGSAALAASNTAALTAPGDPTVRSLFPAALALVAIEDKARALGASFTGKAFTGRVETVPGGFRERFEKCDIYYSPSTGTHELHGEFRGVFDLHRFHDKTPPGLPMTDEQPMDLDRGTTVELAGDAALYRTPSIPRPVLVSGAIRDAWRASGAEEGPYGFPFRDQIDLGGGAAFAEFENDTLYFNGSAIAAPLTAGLTPPQVARAVLKMLQRSVPAPLNILAVIPRSNNPQKFFFRDGGGYTRALQFLVEGVDTNTHQGFLIPLTFCFFADTNTQFTVLEAVLLDFVPNGDGGQTEIDINSTFGDMKRHALRPTLIDLPVPAVVNWLAVKIMPDGALKVYFQPGNGDLAALAVQRELDAVAR
jgi:LGFP repeat